MWTRGCRKQEKAHQFLSDRILNMPNNLINWFLVVKFYDLFFCNQLFWDWMRSKQMLINLRSSAHFKFFRNRNFRGKTQPNQKNVTKTQPNRRETSINWANCTNANTDIYLTFQTYLGGFHSFWPVFLWYF